MNLLGADTDKNGLISGDELANTFFYESPYVYGNAKKAEDISIYTLTGGAKIAYDESDLRGVQIERVIDGSLNALLDGDKNMDGKITFVEHFGSKMMALGSVEMELNGSCSDAGGCNPFELMLEELKKMLEELQQKLQKDLKSADKLKEKAATQGLQALNSMELELLKSQNPLDYERLKNGQNAALSGQNGTKNLGENLNLNGQNSALSSENLNEKNLRLSNQTQSDKNALNLNSQAEFDEQINKTNGENAKFQSENAEFKNENATNQSTQFTSRNEPLTKDLRQINELLSVLNNAANKSLLSSQSQNKLKALESLHSLASSLSEDLRAQIQAKSLKIVDFRA